MFMDDRDYKKHIADYCFIGGVQLIGAFIGTFLTFIAIRVRYTDHTFINGNNNEVKYQQKEYFPPTPTLCPMKLYTPDITPDAGERCK